MEQIDHSVPEPDIASVVKVEAQALSKAKADLVLHKLEETVNAELGDEIAATPAKNPPWKERSAFCAAVIRLVKDDKRFRQRNWPSLATHWRR